MLEVAYARKDRRTRRPERTLLGLMFVTPQNLASFEIHTQSASHEAAMKDVAAQQDAFEVEKGRMSKIFEQQQEKVKLDVGGQVFFHICFVQHVAVPENQRFQHPFAVWRTLERCATVTLDRAVDIRPSC